MKNIHILPTDKPTWFHKSLLSGVLRKSSSCIDDMKHAQGMNIYITSDEEIKDGEYGICLNLVREGFKSYQAVFKMDTEQRQAMEELGGQKKAEVLKVILTTDQDLIKDGVQAIDDEFLNWFVKNPSCEYVKVYYRCDKSDCYLKEWNNCCKEAKPVLTLFAENESKAKYFREQEIIIPKEEPKQRPEKYSERFDNKDNEVADGIFDSSNWGKRMVDDVPKQETLEEAAKKYAKDSFIWPLNKEGEKQSIPPGQSVPTGYKKHQRIAIKHFTNGAKWQQEKMYSEEDLYKAFEAGHDSARLKGSYKSNGTFKEDFCEWFEQFKKKK